MSSIVSSSRVSASSAPKGSSMSRTPGYAPAPGRFQLSAASLRIVPVGTGLRSPQGRPAPEGRARSLPGAQAVPSCRVGTAHCRERLPKGVASAPGKTMPVSSRGSVTRCPADGNRTLGGSHQPGDEAQQRRFAAPRRTDQTDEFVAPHLERNVRHGDDVLATTRDEGLRDMLEGDHRAEARARIRIAEPLSLNIALDHLPGRSDMSNAWVGSHFASRSWASAIACHVVASRSGEIFPSRIASRDR